MRRRAARSSSTTPTRPTPCENAITRAAALCTGQAARRLRLRRRPGSRQAPADGRHSSAARRRGLSSPTTIRAARIRRRSAPKFWPPRPAPSRSATAPRPLPQRSAPCRAGDVLLIAGKGHETGQIVGDRVIPYSDHEAVAALLNGADGRRCAMADALWTAGELRGDLRATAADGAMPGVGGISIERARCAGRSVLRHQGRPHRRT